MCGNDAGSGSRFGRKQIKKSAIEQITKGNLQMKTPIFDFVKKYSETGGVRAHMPGHKGRLILGCENLDITEIKGADELYCADGIIAESENNASSLFKTAHSFYSAGGSTLAIYAMISLVCRFNKNPVILAARNVHKSFIHICAILGCDVEWLYPKHFTHICECSVSGDDIENAINASGRKITAVYLTSPDYLGNIQGIESISAICKKHNVLLLTDNAHGAYLGFLEQSRHPIALGADMCCDSAHKTLPALTGAAYLHISENAPSEYVKNARNELAVFSSTSPSYLILQSLDLLNPYLCGNFREELKTCTAKIGELKNSLRKKGYDVPNNEPLKITVKASSCGMTGFALADIIRKSGIEPEYSDRDYLVLMLTPQNNAEDFSQIEKGFPEVGITSSPLPGLEIGNYPIPRRIMSIRNAVFSEFETVDVSVSHGRICAAPTVSCPPAVTPVVSGEMIDENIIKILEYCGIKKIKVVAE